MRAAENDQVKGHFVGSIVYIERGLYQISSVPQLLVIDGQQRMTTLTLFLLALGRSIEDSGLTLEITNKKIINYYLINNEEENEQYHKLILTKSDKDTLISLISNKKLPEEYSLRINENFTFFLDKIKESGTDLSKLYQGIAKLIIVDISLDRDHDNPQLIFESLNSTGLDLSQGDLIRNYVLMKLEPKIQTDLYNEYWYPIEKSFGVTRDTGIFDRFMRDYLTVKTGKIPNIQDVYTSFKDYVPLTNLNVLIILDDVFRYSNYYLKLAFQLEKDKDINQILTDINTLKVDVSYPFLLEVYDDYDQQKLTKVDFISILRIVESYVFRRMICGVPTNSLNKTFLTISKEIDKLNYLESVRAAFLLKDAYKRYPNNEEFIRELVIKDVYNFRNRNYLLRKLENFIRKEIVDIEAYTIEHIMPQNKNISLEWRKDLGVSWEEVYKTYLHTLGNLTLTRYNSELSDSPFKVKRDLVGGFADSPLRLNKGLGKLESWNEDEIKIRALSLANQALQVWEYPHLSENVLVKYSKLVKGKEEVMYSMADYPELDDVKLSLFMEIRQRIFNLDSSVREVFKKHYITYETTTSFVDIQLWKDKLIIVLNMSSYEMLDPKEKCKEAKKDRRYGIGEVEIWLKTNDEIEYTMFLIKQSFEKHRDEE